MFSPGVWWIGFILEQFILAPSDKLYRGKYRHRVLDGSSNPKFGGGDRFKRFMRWIVTCP